MKTLSSSTATREVSESFRQAFDLINPHLYSVEERIRRQVRAFDPAVEGYVAYACGSSGKRLRPALALLAGGAAGNITASHVDLAVIIELIHVATLIHDDIIDGAEVRRDQPTASAKWGNAISVLLGDCLFAHALRLSTAFSNQEICRRIADAAAEVCTGEIIQTQRRFDLKLTTADYFRIIEMKTAALFAAACELGAFISEATPEIISAMRQFGLRIGTAYQIYDDCLDWFGNEDRVGKTLGTDFEKGKLTLPLLILFHNSPSAERERLSQLILRQESDDYEALSEMLRRSGALNQAVTTAQRMITEGRDSLGQVPKNRFVGGLTALSDHVAEMLGGLRFC